jgi:hypothetical protein
MRDKLRDSSLPQNRQPGAVINSLKSLDSRLRGNDSKEK